MTPKCTLRRALLLAIAGERLTPDELKTFRRRETQR